MLGFHQFLYDPGFLDVFHELLAIQDEFIQSAEAMALLLFNLGVEAGQIAFVLAVLALAWLGRQVYRQAEPALRMLAAYAIGITGSFWAIERIAATFF